MLCHDIEKIIMNQLYFADYHKKINDIVISEEFLEKMISVYDKYKTEWTIVIKCDVCNKMFIIDDYLKEDFNFCSPQCIRILLKNKGDLDDQTIDILR